MSSDRYISDLPTNILIEALQVKENDIDPLWLLSKYQLSLWFDETKKCHVATKNYRATATTVSRAIYECVYKIHEGLRS